MVPGSAKANGVDAEVIAASVDYDDVDVFGGSQPAIPPEVQEAMMYTPVKKRVGALRRSPI